MKKLGWIGLGQMGAPMASNLLKGGFEVNVYNRTADKAAPLVAAGAQAKSSVAELVDSSDIIFLMLTNGAAVKDVLTRDGGVLSNIKPGQTVIDMSTIAPGKSREHAELVAANGARYIDAPVSGSVGPAVIGQLVVLVGSTTADEDQFGVYFAAMGKKTLWFGEQSKGSSAKLVINMLLGISAQGIAETLILADQFGLDLETVMEMISNSGMNTPLFQSKKEMFRSGDYPSAFMLELMTKDLGLINDEVKALKLDLPLESSAHETFVKARDNGKGKLDLAAVILELRELNNL